MTKKQKVINIICIVLAVMLAVGGLAVFDWYSRNYDWTISNSEGKDLTDSNKTYEMPSNLIFANASATQQSPAIVKVTAVI